MDFFSNISSDLQTPWKEMLLHRADNLYSNHFALKYPEIEAQLKLFYTAITRCIERLFFVETSTSKAGDAFIRWSTTTSVTSFATNDEEINKAIATLSDCTNIESMGMNRDEWLAAGLSNAEAADAEEYDYENKCSLLKKAVYCFEQGRHDLFVRKAKIQLRSIELRMKVLDIDVGSNDVVLLRKIEKEAVCIMRGLIEADMGSEVLELCKCMNDLMNNLYPSSDFFQRYLIKNVQSICVSQRKVERELCDQSEPHSKPSSQGPRKELISEYAAEKTTISKMSETEKDEVEGNEFEKAEPLENSPCSVVQSLFSSDEFLSDLEDTFRATDTNCTFTSANPQEELLHINKTSLTSRDEVSFDFDDESNVEHETSGGKSLVDSLRGLFVSPTP